MTHFANMEEEWEWILQDHPGEVLITQESIPIYPQDTHRITEIVALDTGFIKGGTIHLINHLDNYLLFLDK